MRTVLIFSLFGFLFSCTNTSSSEYADYCRDLQELALNEVKKGNVTPIIKGDYHYSDIERYYIWKKHNINVVYPLLLNDIYQIETDSCYNAVMLSYSPDTTTIIKDLDSLSLTKFDNLDKDFLQYHDGKYYIVGIAKNQDFTAKRIDANYYDKLTKFQASYTQELADTVKCEFWYEIDTFGNVVNVEIYNHATPSIDSAVIDFFTSFKYIPSNDGANKLHIRDNELIYFLGRKNEMPTSPSTP